jgi:ribonuclease-3
MTRRGPTDVSHERVPTAAARLEVLEAAIGHRFADPALLLSAVTHRSFLNEVDHPDSSDNERLEFLGDALIDFVAADHLFRRLPDAPEGELTALRAQLVCEPALAGFARRLDLGSHLRLGRGEDGSGGRERPAILCNAFEALVGAVYLDAGIATATTFVLGFLEGATRRVLAEESLKDAKSLFQELSQRAWQVTPAYLTVGESGPDHDKLFRVAVLVAGQEWGVGEGGSKAIAAQIAARQALARFGGTGADRTASGASRPLSAGAQQAGAGGPAAQVEDGPPTEGQDRDPAASTVRPDRAPGR